MMSHSFEFAATVLGVRTMSATLLLDICPTSDQAMSVEARELMTITRSDVGDCPIMDMVVPATDRTLGMFITSTGAIYRCSAPDGSKTV